MTTADIPNRRGVKKERGGPQMCSKLPRVWTLITYVNVTAGYVTFTVASLRIAAVLVEAFVKFGTGFLWCSSSYLAGTLICAAPSSDEWSPCTAECRPSCTGAIGRRKETKQMVTKHALSTQRKELYHHFPLVSNYPPGSLVSGASPLRENSPWFKFPMSLCVFFFLLSYIPFHKLLFYH